VDKVRGSLAKRIVEQVSSGVDGYFTVEEGKG
jgi:hypothetical protein